MDDVPTAAEASPAAIPLSSAHCCDDHVNEILRKWAESVLIEFFQHQQTVLLFDGSQPKPNPAQPGAAASQAAAQSKTFIVAVDRTEL